MRRTRLMGRATAGAVGVAMAVRLLPSVGPASSSLLLPDAAWAATRSASPISAAGAASSAVKVRAVAGGLYQSLALSSSGAVFAWGWNIVGQLGNGSTTGSAVPVKSEAARRHEGDRDLRRLRPQPGADLDRRSARLGQELRRRPRQREHDRQRRRRCRLTLPAGTKVTAVAAGADHSLAVTSTGAVLGWGVEQLRPARQRQHGKQRRCPVNVSLPAGTQVTAVAAGSLHTPGADLDRHGVSPGATTSTASSATAARTNSDVPVKVKLPAGTKVTAVAAGGYVQLWR